MRRRGLRDPAPRGEEPRFRAGLQHGAAAGRSPRRRQLIAHPFLPLRPGGGEGWGEVEAFKNAALSGQTSALPRGSDQRLVMAVLPESFLCCRSIFLLYAAA